MTGAHADLLGAWDKVSGPQTAIAIMKKAVELAKRGDFGPLKDLLPYIARKMPERVEAEVSGYQRMVLVFPEPAK